MRGEDAWSARKQGALAALVHMLAGGQGSQGALCPSTPSIITGTRHAYVARAQGTARPDTTWQTWAPRLRHCGRPLDRAGAQQSSCPVLTANVSAAQAGAGGHEHLWGRVPARL